MSIKWQLYIVTSGYNTQIQWYIQSDYLTSLNLIYWFCGGNLEPELSSARSYLSLIIYLHLYCIPRMGDKYGFIHDWGMNPHFLGDLEFIPSYVFIQLWLHCFLNFSLMWTVSVSINLIKEFALLYSEYHLGERDLFMVPTIDVVRDS